MKSKANPKTNTKNSTATRASAKARPSQSYSGSLGASTARTNTSNTRSVNRANTSVNAQSAPRRKSPPRQTGSTSGHRFVTSFRIAVVLIILLIIIVAVSVWIHYYFSDKVTVERELPRIAKEYYEEYYYDKLIDTMGGKADATMFKKYTERGLPEIRLRQLMNYNNKQNSDLSTPLKALGCDTNKSKVTYLPVTPFGKTDYTVKYDLRCTTDIQLDTADSD